MNEEGGFPIIPAIVGLLVLSYLGFEVNRRKKRLRAIFDTIEESECRIAGVLEQMVARGELKPIA
jgi:hypothetical protein